MTKKLSLFEDKKIRKIYKNNKWYFSILDIITSFTDSTNPTQYLKTLKQKDKELQKEWNNICIQLNMPTLDGKIRKIMSTDTAGVLRIIESIQTEKTEPIKKWLARLGAERIEELSNPELIMDRMKKTYKLKGYSNAWIEQREKEITTRHSLKEEWESRGINQNKDYLLLTNEIYKSTFNIDVEEYKKIKGINNIDYLKDSMNNLELAIINLSEIIAVELHQQNKGDNIESLKDDITEVGKIMKSTKENLETKLKRPIISPENYLNITNK